MGDTEFPIALARELGPRRPDGTDTDKDVRLQQIWDLLSLKLFFLVREGWELRYRGSGLDVCGYPVADEVCLGERSLDHYLPGMRVNSDSAAADVDADASAFKFCPPPSSSSECARDALAESLGCGPRCRVTWVWHAKGGAETGLDRHSTGDPDDNEPMAGEVAWFPSPDVETFQTTKDEEREPLQRRCLTDAGTYRGTDDRH